MYRERKLEAHQLSTYGNDDPSRLATFCERNSYFLASVMTDLPSDLTSSALVGVSARLFQDSPPSIKDLNGRIRVVLTPPMTSGLIDKTTPCFLGHTSLSRSQRQATSNSQLLEKDA
ncbi:uncharacterized protein BKA55DRAFT_37113 [Fusarium redolens]|uniref:Uncharacterized protein n=1 Tax=Fusarium redolens TaxID=48865 RepID=A0A9P9KXE2_FUSRE|nr:uncharacterized protein BKA55DRAFT_37113 [Fusarium redolens]KAH7270191.1 hypothetical protein BKA55DRAFT_37113 [Fusarium redolens]